MDTITETLASRAQARLQWASEALNGYDGSTKAQRSVLARLAKDLLDLLAEEG